MTATYVTNFSNLDQATKNYFYRLASKDGRRSGAQIFRDEIPDSVQDCPVETAAFINGDSSVGTEAHHASHVQSDANGGAFSDDNIVMERASDNLSRGSDNMTPVEQHAAISNSEADAAAIDAHYTHDVVDAEVVTNDILLSNSDVALSVGNNVSFLEAALEWAGNILPVIATVETTMAITKAIPSRMPTPVKAAVIAATSVVSYAVYQNPLAVMIRGIFKLGWWWYRKSFDSSRTLTPAR